MYLTCVPSQGPKLGDDVLRIAKQSRRRRLCFPISTKSSLQRAVAYGLSSKWNIQIATSFCLQPPFCAHNVLTFPQGSWSQHCLGSLYWAWAGWAGRQICMLLVQKCILRQIFKKAKQQICTSNSQICFPAQTAQAQYRLPRQRWLREPWLGGHIWYLVVNIVDILHIQLFSKMDVDSDWLYTVVFQRHQIVCTKYVPK